MQPKTTSVYMSEIVKDNPTLCLSALRVFANCHKCQVFKDKLITKGLKVLNLKCKPQIKPEIKKLLKKRQQLLKELKETHDRIIEIE